MTDVSISVWPRSGKVGCGFLYLVTRHDYASLVVGFLIVYMIIYSYSKNKEE